MNDKKEKIDESIALKLLEEIEQNKNISQRTLSGKLGIALGLVNTYIKLLVKKGYIRISNFPRSRYTYLLTPEGMSEKTRLVYKHLSYYNNMFRKVREDSREIFKKLANKGLKKVAFVGVDEFAEIVYLSLIEADLTLVGVYDDVFSGRMFLKNEVMALQKLSEINFDVILITSVKRKKEIYDSLMKLNIKEDIIISLIN